MPREDIVKVAYYCISLVWYWRHCMCGALKLPSAVFVAGL